MKLSIGASRDWPYSSFQQYQAKGFYEEGWGCNHEPEHIRGFSFSEIWDNFGGYVALLLNPPYSLMMHAEG